MLPSLRVLIRSCAGLLAALVPALHAAQGARAAVPPPTTGPGAPGPIPGTAVASRAAVMGPTFDVAPGSDDNGLLMVYDLTRVAANGISLRQCTSGAINLVGIPPGSSVVRAFLYWQWISIPGPVPGLQDVMWFGRLPRSVPNTAGGIAATTRLRARAVQGTLVGAGLDPCWAGGGNFTYRADVTALVRGGGTYTVWLPTGAAPGARWEDPFSQFAFPPGPFCEGASLVVVYQNPLEPPGTTLIYDSGLAGVMFMTTPGIAYNLTGFVAPGSESRWINIGGDGQSGAGYSDLYGLGFEVTTFQGSPLAGGGAGTPFISAYNDSDWNGSGNKPVGQLWDTSGHEVSAYLAAGSAAASIRVFEPTGSPFADCLVPAANVLWMR